MRARFKPLAEQIIVVTGATSGLGLAVVRKAAEAGASLLLTSADEPAVRKLAEEINAAGGRAHAVAADLANPDACAKVARATVARFGGFDTWISAGGGDQACSNGVREAAAHLRAGSRPGVLVHMSDGPLEAEVRRGVKTYGRAINLTHVVVPRNVKSFDVAAAAALYAATNHVSRMEVSPRGKLSAFSEARKHQGVLVGVGVLALAGVALWAGRRQIAAAAQPHVGRALRPVVLEAARRRPLQTARLAMRHPRQAMKLVTSLR